MLKTQRAAHVALILFFDILALWLAFGLAWLMRDSLGRIIAGTAGLFHIPIHQWVRKPGDMPLFYRILFSSNPLVDFRNHVWMFYLAAPCWLFFLHLQQGYGSVIRNARQKLAMCTYAGLWGLGAFVIFLFLLKMNGVSRLLLVNFLILGTLALWAARALIIPLIVRRSRNNGHNLLVIGNASAARRLGEMLQQPAYGGSKLLGYVGEDEPQTPETPQRLGKLDELETILDREVVDEVVIMRSQDFNNFDISDAGQNGQWGHILELCLQRGRSVSLFGDVVPPAGAKVEAQLMGGIPMLVLHNTPQNPLPLAIKGFMDRTIALVALLILSPLFAVLAFLIKKYDGGPVFYAQQRVGRNGRIFKFYKFRSMVLNASETLEKMRREEPEKYRAINIMEEPFFKAKEGDDPRITPVGRFIRKYSLDELPQFWNVLRGDMSLVGPRPPLPNEVEQLAPWQRRKLSVKGGLTCIWQASGRNDITNTDEWMRLDLEYIDNWSLWLDLKLLFKTLKVLVRPKGAS
jgi:exopolysaccharide biosynthesis polyprenyl glycosylphosphotransferase